MVELIDVGLFLAEAHNVLVASFVARTAANPPYLYRSNSPTPCSPLVAPHNTFHKLYEKYSYGNDINNGYRRGFVWPHIAIMAVVQIPNCKLSMVESCSTFRIE